MSLPSHPSFSLIPCLRIRLPGADVMTGMVIGMIVVHILLDHAGGSIEVPRYYASFGLSWDGFSSGKIWQMLTHVFIHANWLHLMLNLVILWLVGGRVIHMLGYWKWLQIVTAGVLGGGCLHLITGILMVRNGYSEGSLVGVSGACIALLLVLTNLSPDSRMWPIPMRGKSLGLGLVLAEFLLWLMHPGFGLPVFSKIGGQMVSGGGAGIFQMGHACHLGGALAGWWMACRILAPPPISKKFQKTRSERESSVRQANKMKYGLAIGYRYGSKSRGISRKGSEPE